MKIKIKAKDCRLNVTVKMSWGEVIDEKELDRFARVYLRGFLTPKLIKKGKIEYRGSIGTPLVERMKRPVSKRDFFFIIEQIVVATQKLQKNTLAIHNLIMDTRYIFINDNTKEVQFLYVPATIKDTGLNIISLLNEVIYSAKPMQEKDVDYISRFAHFLGNMQPLDLSKIEGFIEREDRSIVNTIKKNNSGQSGFMTSDKKHYFEHLSKEKDADATGLLDESDESTGLLSDDEATGLLDAYKEDEATGLLDPDEEATGLLNSDEEDEATGLLRESNENISFPVLFRVLTEEKILVDKPVFRLGKEKSYVDYFVSNNIAVSRSHADIITRGNKYFVKDLNSKNHTFINDKELPIQCEIEIRNGDCLRLANEEFIFQL